MGIWWVCMSRVCGEYTVGTGSIYGGYKLSLRRVVCLKSRRRCRKLKREGVGGGDNRGKLSRVCSVRYRYSRYRYRCRTELTEVSVPVFASYRTYRSVRYRYWRCTKLTEVSGTGTKVCAGTAGTGIDVPNMAKFPVPVLMYQTYPSCRCRY